MRFNACKMAIAVRREKQSSQYDFAGDNINYLRRWNIQPSEDIESLFARMGYTFRVGVSYATGSSEGCHKMVEESPRETKPAEVLFFLSGRNLPRGTGIASTQTRRSVLIGKRKLSDVMGFEIEHGKTPSGEAIAKKLTPEFLDSIVTDYIVGLSF
jgi:hypothetical protein